MLHLLSVSSNPETSLHLSMKHQVIIVASRLEKQKREYNLTAAYSMPVAKGLFILINIIRHSIN